MKITIDDSKFEQVKTQEGSHQTIGAQIEKAMAFRTSYGVLRGRPLAKKLGFGDEVYLANLCHEIAWNWSCYAPTSAHCPDGDPGMIWYTRDRAAKHWSTHLPEPARGLLEEVLTSSSPHVQICKGLLRVGIVPAFPKPVPGTFPVVFAMEDTSLPTNTQVENS